MSSPRNFLPSIGLMLPASPRLLRGQSVGYAFQRPMTPTQFQVMSPRHQLMSPTNQLMSPNAHSAFAWPVRVETPRREHVTGFMTPASPATAWRPARDAAPLQYPKRELFAEVQHTKEFRPPSKSHSARGFPSSSKAKAKKNVAPSTPKFGKWLRDLAPAAPTPQMPPHCMPVRRRNGVEAAPKLGPERYKQMRVDGQRRGRAAGMGWRAEEPAHNNNQWANPTKRSENGSTNTPQVKQVQEKKKQSLYKTELCTNWMLTSNCTYGNKCHFAHGIDDLKSRTRPENFKTQPCCDPARDGSRRCLYGSRCNYCHPGEAIRRPVGKQYFDLQYYKNLEADFGDNEFPFGIYV